LAILTHTDRQEEQQQQQQRKEEKEEKKKENENFLKKNFSKAHALSFILRRH